MVKPWYETMTIGFLDVETTGLSAKDCITEFALVTSDDSVRYQTLVCPEALPSDEAAHLTGLDWPELQHAPTWDIVSDRVSACLRACDVLVAYNALFDRKMLTAQYKLFDEDMPGIPWVDAFEWARLVPTRSHSLIDKAQHFNCQPDKGSAHRAMYDVLMLRSVFGCISDKMPVTLEATVSEEKTLREARKANRW